MPTAAVALTPAPTSSLTKEGRSENTKLHQASRAEWKPRVHEPVGHGLLHCFIIYSTGHWTWDLVHKSYMLYLTGLCPHNPTHAWEETHFLSRLGDKLDGCHMPLTLQSPARPCQRQRTHLLQGRCLSSAANASLWPSAFTQTAGPGPDGMTGRCGLAPNFSHSWEGRHQVCWSRGHTL